MNPSPNRRSTSVFSLLWKILMFVVLIFVGMSHFFANSLIFYQFPSSYSDGSQYISLKNGNDRVVCRYLSNPDSEYLVIYSHGNAEDLGNVEPILKGFRAAGISVLGYDYPGYGLSSGRPTEKSCYESLGVVIDFAEKELKYPPEKIILHGRSLGSGPVVEWCKRRDFGGMILESAFKSTFQTVLKVGWIPWDRFQNLRKIPYVNESTLILHGGADEVIPIEHGKALFEASKAPKLYYWVDGAGHNDLVANMGSEYWSLMQDFISYLDVE